MKRSNISLMLSYLMLIALAICFLYPATWVIMSSFKVGDSLFSDSLIPKALTFAHYRDLFVEQSDKQVFFMRWFWNTFRIATISMVLGTFIQILTAYSISRFRFYGRKTIMSLILILGMFPGFMSMIAIYIILLQLNLLNTQYALILVYTAGAALHMFVAKGFFDQIPHSLAESAQLDGASHMDVFMKIMLPLSKPMITYISLTTFTGAWVDFIFARLILRSRENWTLAVGLYELVNSYSSTEFTLFAAGAVLTSIPIAVLFLFLQRFLIEGVTAGASKG